MIKYKAENPQACHVCSGYRIYLNGWVDEYASDDGEPKGSSGLPILNVLSMLRDHSCKIIIG